MMSDLNSQMTLGEMREGEPSGVVPPEGGPLPGFLGALRTAVVSGVFVAVVAGLLVWNHVQHLARDPLDCPDYLALHEKLLANPQDEALKAQLRELDLQLRQEYFRARTFNRWGTLLLVAGLITFAVAAKTASTLRRPLPHPSATEVWDEAHEKAVRQRILAVGAFVAVLLVAVGFLAWQTAGALKLAAEVGQLARAHQVEQTPQPTGEKATGDTGGQAAGTFAAAASATPGGPSPDDSAPAEEYARFWPRFRGPSGNGISPHPDPPVEWDAASGKGIVWKAAVELPGNNSPVVWGKFVFLTGATDERRVCYAFDAESGQRLWEREIPATPESRGKKIKVLRDTGLAAPTVATDGRRVYAIFATGDLTALDFEGNILWVKGLGVPDNAYGHAASLCTYRNWVIVQFDQGQPDDDKSRLYAFEGPTGRTVWEVTRPTGNSWTSPIIATLCGREQLITVADPLVISYNPENGQEWWRFDGTTGDCGPSPVAIDDLVIAGSEYAYSMFGIRADGEGDVTATHKVWEAEEALPDTCSPLAFDNYVLWTSSMGMMVCYRVRTGEMLWEHEFPESTFTSSPSLAAGKVYLFSKEGRCWVGTVDESGFKVEQENDLGEGCVTSPAFQPGRLFIRTEHHLWCIGR